MSIFDKAKDAVGKAKGLVDDQVEKHGDKMPSQVRGVYDKASDAVGKVVPGETPKHEQIIKDD